MRLQKLLDRIETAGNRLPAPTLLFIYLAGAVLLLSALAAALGLTAVHPLTGARLEVVNLLSTAGLHQILTSTVSNFTQFAPVGTVLVAVLGIGIAEHSGLLGTLLRVTVQRAPARLLTFLVVLCGVLSSIAADTGYVILVPLAALMFHAAGRHPLIGIAAAFAGVSGGYSANILITPIDAILAGVSAEAARLVDPGYQVSAAANYYFMVASTLMLALVGTWVTESLVAPRLARYSATEGSAPHTTPQPADPQERRGLLGVAGLTLVTAALLLAGLLPETGALRDPKTGGILQSPFMAGIVTLVAVYAALAGIVYGRLSGRYRRWGDCLEGMEQHMAAMGTYLVLMFFAAQFVNYFAWSNLGGILAIEGARWLQDLAPPTAVVLVALVFIAAFVNLFIGSASAKWALLAPVFVPMLLLAGLSPEATQVAYRIGDSSTNLITPLMPYFGVVVAFAQRYKKDLGVGSLVAMMLPYSLAFLLCWSALLSLWVVADLPLGPAAPVLIER
jgi:aminobenzoyl-glutamate transport protein